MAGPAPLPMNDGEEHGGLRDGGNVEADPGRLAVAPGNIGAGHEQRMDVGGAIDGGILGGATGGGETGPVGTFRGAGGGGGGWGGVLRGGAAGSVFLPYGPGV